MAEKNFDVPDDGDERDARPFSEQMREALKGYMPDLSALAPTPFSVPISGSHVQGLESPLPNFDFSDTYEARTAEHTQRAAEVAEESASYLRRLTEAMIRSVELSEATREDARAAQESANRSSRDARITGYGSLLVALLALGFSLAPYAPGFVSWVRSLVP